MRPAKLFSQMLRCCPSVLAFDLCQVCAATQDIAPISAERKSEIVCKRFGDSPAD